jgi:hypothetical protein
VAQEVDHGRCANGAEGTPLNRADSGGGGDHRRLPAPYPAAPDDCLYALQPTIPHLTRSSLHRCLERNGISRLPEMEGDKPKTKRFAAYAIGYFHIDIAPSLSWTWHFEQAGAPGPLELSS